MCLNDYKAHNPYNTEEVQAMKVMMMRKADKNTEQGVMPSDELLQAMGDYNEQLIKAGVWVSGDGLKPSSLGVRVEFKDGQAIVTDGPFAETKELLAGYTIIEVGSMEEAIAWAQKWPAMDADGNFTLELRPYYGMEDFEPGDGLDKHRKNDELLASLTEK